MEANVHSKKAAFERNMVSALFTAMPKLLQRSWRSSTDPEVDVLVARRDGEIVAVEVSRLHPSGGEEARKWEETQNKILRRAAAGYEARGLPNLEVVVFWSAWVDPTKQRQEVIARDLEEFVSAHIPPMGEARDFDLTDDVPADLPHAIDQLQIRRFFEHPNHWHSPQSGFVPNVSPEEVRARLAAKEGRARKYRGSYAERWLLLAVGAEGRSTWGDISPHLAEEQFTSSFDRVFVVRPPNEAIELRLSRAV